MSARFPEGRDFAFTILDDTDDSTLENVRPVYERLHELGLRTTKTVWPMDCPEGSRIFFAADTLQRREYLEFTQQLATWGFEIASHGATMESSRRERVEAGLAFLLREFGEIPRLHANHAFNRESVYWGSDRFQTPALRRMLTWLGLHEEGQFEGVVEGSEYFCGDLFLEHFQYVRNLTTGGIDTLAFDPETPYALPSTPFVRQWFSTSDAPDAEAFKQRITPAAIDALVRAGGACILSTHLGKGFSMKGEVDPEVDGIFSYLAGQNGWFVPVSELLDHLVSQGAGRRRSPLSLLRLELRYLFDRLRYRD